MSTSIDFGGYVVTRDFTGIRNGRTSSPMQSFGDANRHAMAACCTYAQEVRVYARDGQFIVSYISVNGRAQVLDVGAA